MLALDPSYAQSEGQPQMQLSSDLDVRRAETAVVANCGTPRRLLCRPLCTRYKQALAAWDASLIAGAGDAIHKLPL
jgi:hypothetical protein